MTEDEAKKKRCCVIGAPEHPNWDGVTHACIGTACVAWEWVVSPETAAEFASSPHVYTSDDKWPKVEIGRCGRCDR